MGNALVGIEEWVVVSVFGVVVKGEPGVGEPVGIFDKRASLIGVLHLHYWPWEALIM